MPGGKLIYLSLGSNLGDRAANLERAAQAIRHAARDGSQVVLLPEAMDLGWTDPQLFLVPLGASILALVEAFREDLPPRRRRRLRYAGARGPRVIDLDILFYGASVIRTEEMEIPHPRMAQRRFVLVPLAELAPGLRHPVLGSMIAEMIAAAQDKSTVRLWQPQGSDVHSK